MRPYSEGVVVHGGAGVVHGQVEEFGDDQAHDAEHAHATMLDLRLLKKKELRELMRAHDILAPTDDVVSASSL